MKTPTSVKNITKSISEAKFTTALIGDDQKVDDSASGGNQSNESMFGDGVNKKAGKPIKGYRWMCFTFTMIIILCLMVFFHDTVNQSLLGLLHGCAD